MSETLIELVVFALSWAVGGATFYYAFRFTWWFLGRRDKRVGR